MNHLAAGAVLGDFRIEAILGRGGMGVVYRAVQVSLGRPVALKVIAPAVTEEPGFRQRFERESRLAASLDHPHIVPVFAAGEHDGLLYIAMRLVEGANLSQLLRAHGPLEPARAVAIIRQIASALDEAHRLGLVHRDVKPANVLIGERAGEEHAYLTDFGLTKRTESVAGITGSGSWVGTLDYIAPEQLRGEKVDGRADVYSLGCVLYEALTGQVPFPRESDIAKLWAHTSDPPPLASDTAPEVPAALGLAARRAMAKVPGERYASAGELASALAGEADDADQPTVALAERPPSRSRRSRGRGLRRAAPLMAVIGVAAVALLAIRNVDDDGDRRRSPGATGAPQRGVATPPGPLIGPLAQLGGPRGCLSSGTVGGCAKTQGLDGAKQPAVSQDGRSVYVASIESDSVTTFARDPGSGQLSQLPRGSGCLTQRLQPNCAVARGLAGASSVAVSRDGRNVYVAATRSRAVAVFARDRRTGALRQLFGSAGCIRKTPGEGCSTVERLPAPARVLVAGDDRRVYVGGQGGVAVLVRDLKRRGALTPAAAALGCVGEDVSGCVSARGVSDTRDIAEAPRGRELYVAAGRSNRVLVLRMRPGGSFATRQDGARACLSQLPGDDDCPGIRALRLPVALAVTEDGRSIYVASQGSDAIAVLRRDPTASLSQLPGPAGCVSQAGGGGCMEGRALNGVNALALSPDGRNLYSASGRVHALALFSRRASGELRRLPSRSGCVIRFGVLGCSHGRALTAATGLTVAPDGRSVYVVSEGERIGGIAVFRRLDP